MCLCRTHLGARTENAHAPCSVSFRDVPRLYMCIGNHSVIYTVSLDPLALIGSCGRECSNVGDWQVLIRVSSQHKVHALTHHDHVITHDLMHGAAPVAEAL